MVNIPSVKLPSGDNFDQIGFGTWQSAPGEVGQAVEVAIKAGYRHLDLAKVYQNQKEVAEGIKRAGVPRKELFIVSKLWCNAHNPKMVEAALDDTLQELDLEYLDLYLIHWPVQFKGDSSDMQKLFPTANNEVQLDDDTSYGLADTWKAMNDLVKTGKVRNVGVSNCTKATLEKLIEKTGLVPAVNQMEYHLRLPEKELIKYCADKGIVWTAYSPLGNNTIGMPLLISDETVKEVAEKHKCDPAQVIIAWCTLDGKTVIPKSVTPKRIESNLLALEACKLDKDDIAKLEGVVGKTGERRFNVPMTYSPRWPINVYNDPAEKDAKNQLRV